MITPFKNDYAFGVRVRTVDGRRVVLGNLNGRAPDQIAEALGALMHAPRTD